MRWLRVGSDRSYAISRLTYARNAVRALQQLEWDVWVNEFSAFAPLWVPARLRRRGLLFFQHFMGRHAIAKHPLVGWAALLAERRVLTAYPHILTVSPSVQERIRQRVAEDVSVECVVNGVESSHLDGSSEEPEEEFILYLGRIDVHTKGLDVLVQAMARIAPDHPQLRLTIAGGGEPRQQRQLRSLISRCRLDDQVDLRGRVQEAEKMRLLRAAQFLCMPSRYEGWGMVAVEASACGKAVVATDIDGLRDAVRDGHTGVLVRSGDADQLAAAMRKLLAAPERRRTLGRQGREWSRRFDWDQLAIDQENILKRLAGVGPMDGANTSQKVSRP